MTIIRSLLLFILFVSAIDVYAQYPPPAGQPGSTAIYKDSSVFVDWASGCTVMRGWQDISNHALGYASVGDSSMALGPAGSNGVVSLGDGGIATLTFDHTIVNGPSWDFAVFENSFSDYYLELAFVEVSSNGVNYYRFPASSLTDTVVQVGPYDSLDARKLNNLAGKYRALYGTPFDLEELKDKPGLNVNNITHIRVIDVVGSLQTQYAAYDTAGRKINDPWPTPFPSCGFDLDAVGVIWNTTNAIQSISKASENVMVWPNPASDHINIRWPGRRTSQGKIRILDITDKCIIESAADAGSSDINIGLSSINPGIYVLQLQSDEQIITKKLIIR